MATRKKRSPTYKKNRSAQRRLYLANKAARASIHKRVRAMVKEQGGVTAFAKRHGIIPKYVYKWYSVGMTPSTNYLLKFAAVSGISPEWLLLGKGKPYLNGTNSPTKKAA